MNGIGEPRHREFTTKIFRSFQVLSVPNGHIYPRATPLNSASASRRTCALYCRCNRPLFPDILALFSFFIGGQVADFSQPDHRMLSLPTPVAQGFTGFVN